MSNDKHTKVRRYHPIEGLESMAGGVVDGDYVQYSDYEALQQRITELERRIAELMAVVDAQAEDEGLWFISETAPEAYLQHELRRLHSAIEAIAKAGG